MELKRSDRKKRNPADSKANQIFNFHSIDSAPESYSLVKSDKNWQLAMEDELNAMDKNQVWKIIDIPP